LIDPYIAQFVHPSVDKAAEREASWVTLAVVPVEGEDERVKAEIGDRGGSFDAAGFRMLEVDLPVSELEAFATLDCLQSVSLDEPRMEPLEGNSSTPLE